MSPLARLSVGLAFGALVACAPARDSDREAASGALIGGSTAAPDTFPATVALAPVPHGGRPDGGASPLGRTCTAARIGPRHLLLAAHCVIAPSSVSPIWKRGDAALLLHDSTRGWQDVVVDAVFAHPSWIERCEESYCAASETTAKIDAPDVAIVRLASVPDDVATAEIDERPLAPGDPVTLNGFGCNANVDVADDRASVALAFAPSEVLPFAAAVHEGSPVTSADAPAAGIYALTRGPGADGRAAGLCPGDSGGPLYRTVDGVARVVGVNANYTFVPEGAAGAGLPVTNWHTRLDTASRHDVARWLRDAVARTD